MSDYSLDTTLLSDVIYVLNRFGQPRVKVQVAYNGTLYPITKIRNKGSCFDIITDNKIPLSKSPTTLGFLQMIHDSDKTREDETFKTNLPVSVILTAGLRKVKATITELSITNTIVLKTVG